MSTALNVHEEPDALFRGVNIRDFISGRESRYDIFIRLAPDRYVKVAHAGEAITMERVRSYMEKGARLLHLRCEDYGKYIGMAVSLASALPCSTSLGKERKLGFLKHAGEIVVKNLYLEPVEKEQYAQAGTVVDAVLSTCAEVDDLLQLLVSLRQVSERLLFHSLAVSVHCALIARQLEWENPANIHRVAMAGLFHDIGKKELHPDLLEKPESAMTAEEAGSFQTHPARGAAILQAAEAVPSEICQIVAQHHEDSSGRGYPAGLHKRNILPLSRLVAVANGFCNLTFPAPGVKPLTGLEAVLCLGQHQDLHFDQEFLAPLEELFKKPKR